MALPSCAWRLVIERNKNNRNSLARLCAKKISGIIEAIDLKNVDKNLKSGAKISHGLNKMTTGENFF
jgi:hypothetical protein